MCAGNVTRGLCTGAFARGQSAPRQTGTPGNSLEVLGVLGDSHVDDIQGMLVVLLGGEEQCQQVECVGIVLAHHQCFLQLLHGTRDLPKEMASLGTFPRALGPGASQEVSESWALGNRAHTTGKYISQKA